MSIPAVRVFSSSALTLCFDLAGRDYTFHWRAFYVLFQKDSVSGLGLKFKCVGLG